MLQEDVWRACRKVMLKGIWPDGAVAQFGEHLSKYRPIEFNVPWSAVSTLLFHMF